MYSVCIVPGCGRELPQTFIPGGEEQKYSSAPWNTGIYYQNKKNEYELICSGTLISPNLVVSGKNKVHYFM